MRKRVEINGVVEGLGFRPYVYRVAKRFDIRARFLYSSGGVRQAANAVCAQAVIRK